MKRLIAIAVALLSIGFVASSPEAKAADLANHNSTISAASTVAQWQRDRYGRRYYDRRSYNRRRARTFTRSRVVRYGRRLYRETYVVRYLPSGRVNTRLISRVRIG
jgi:hypothetical protein